MNDEIDLNANRHKRSGAARRRGWFVPLSVGVAVLLVLAVSCSKQATPGPTSPTSPTTSTNTTVMPGVTVTMPPGWMMQSGSGQGAVTLSNVRESGPLSDRTLQSEALLGIFTLENSNPSGLVIEDWFNQRFAGGFSSELLDKKTISVAGRTAVRIEVVEIGRRVHVYVPKGSDVIEITYGLYAPTFVDSYEAIVRSLQF